MKEIQIGLKISTEEGISFFGIDEVNSAIKIGVKVVEIKPGDAIMSKIAEDDGNIRLKLSGFSINVILDE